MTKGRGDSGKRALVWGEICINEAVLRGLKSGGLAPNGTFYTDGKAVAVHRTKPFEGCVFGDTTDTHHGTSGTCYEHNRVDPKKHVANVSQIDLLDGTTLNEPMHDVDNQPDVTVIGGDIGLHNILVLTDGKTHTRLSAAQFFSQCQSNRRNEKLQRQRASYRVWWKNDDDGERELLTVQAVDAKLSADTWKTSDPVRFAAQFRLAMRVWRTNREFHFDMPRRVARWHSRINRRRAQDKFVNEVKRVFAVKDTSKALIALGSWRSGGHHMKGHAPTISSGWYAIFRRFGFHVAVVDEFRTSKMCAWCWQDLQHYDKEAAERHNARCAQQQRSTYGARRVPSRSHSSVLVHKTIPHSCDALIARDRGAAFNIWMLAIAALAGRERPAPFRKKEARRDGGAFAADKLSTDGVRAAIKAERDAAEQWLGVK
jgi:hypothetical protein